MTTPTAAEFNKEDELALRYPAEFLPAYDAGEPGTFPGVEGVSIAYRFFRVANEKGAVVLLPGRAEALLKYAGLMAEYRCCASTSSAGFGRTRQSYRSDPR